MNGTLAGGTDRQLRLLVIVGCAAFVGCSLLPYAGLWGGERWPSWVRLPTYSAVTAAEAILFLLAARRSVLGRRLQQSLLMLGGSMLLVCYSDLLVVWRNLPTYGPALANINDALELTYATLGLIALFRMPLAPTTRTGAWLVAVDITTAVGGMALVLFAVTLSNAVAVHATPDWSRIVQYAFFTTGSLVALNLILVRGLARPIPVAIWFLTGTVVLEVGYWVLAQQHLVGLRPDRRPIDVVFALDQTCYALAGLTFLTTSAERDQESLTPEWLRALNPLPSVAVIGAGLLLVERVVSGNDAGLSVVAIGMFLLSVLLVVRVTLAAHDRAQLLRAEAETIQRLQNDRVAALRRVAGGIAHEFNNLMTIIIGTAEFGQHVCVRDHDVCIKFERIERAGHRAAELTGRLLTFSGGAPTRLNRISVQSVLTGMEPRLRALAGPTVATSLEIDPQVGPVEANAPLVEEAVIQLATNAVHAMPEGGTLQVMLNQVRLRDGELADAVMPAPAGPYAVVTVRDTGVGIAPSDLARIFDPFFTSRSLAVASGLGLAVVHGTMASHGGGIAVQSTLGAGTAIRLYLPLAKAPAHTEPEPLRASA